MKDVLLFRKGLEERKCLTFEAHGFAAPVSGVIHRGTNPPVCGMPLGGIETGCIDIEANGLWGFCTIFNSLCPRRGPINLPFLGVSVGKQAWVLTTLNMSWRDDAVYVDKKGAFGPQHAGVYQAARLAKEIRYWGHFPIVDMEYVTDAPVQAALRAWSPFLPGDVKASNLPGAVFEIHLLNSSDQDRAGAVVLSFPGPSEAEAGTTTFERRRISERHFAGVLVHSPQAQYILAAVDESDVRTGGELGMDGEAWAVITGQLPHAVAGPGAALAVDYVLTAGEAKIIRFLLCWHSPEWNGKGFPTDQGTQYTHMYAAQYPRPLDAARRLAENHESILQRILAWQAVIYEDQTLPEWLRDGLVNILHLIPETAVWAQAKPPIGQWCRPEDGLFAMNESPRWCPQMECIPCGFYGSLPLVYFFPELALSTLRAYKAYQGPEGQMSWVFGGCTAGSGAYELTNPILERHVGPQTTLNGACYVEMVDKLWRRSGDDDVLREFYESVKKTTIFTMNLCPNSGPLAVVRMPTVGLPNHDWYEFCEMKGVVPHVGGIHLAQLRMAKRMANAMGDSAFAEQCGAWISQGSDALEAHGWTGKYYLLYNELETTDRQDDVIMAYQLDGEWIARFHGCQGVFRNDRVETTLETIKHTNVAMTNGGAVTFCKPGGAELGVDDWSPGFWGTRGVHPAGTWILSMLYMYGGQSEFGLDLARRTYEEVVRRGWFWDWPCVIDGAETYGPRIGTDYYQALILWSLPAAIVRQDLTGPCRPEGLVSRLISVCKGID